MHRTVALLVGALALASVPLALLARGGRRPDAGRPEEADRVYFVSAALFSPDPRDPAAARQRAVAAHGLLLRGVPFAELARAQSDDPASREMGGFLGAVPVFLDNAQNLHGAVQVLEEGQLSKPVQTALGWYLLLRHPYEEGRRLEARWRLPLMGFSLPYEGLEGGEGRTKEQARAQAEQALAALRAGALTLEQARARHGPTAGQARPDGFIELLGLSAGTLEIHEALSRVAEGAWLEAPIDTRQGWGVFQRGRALRSVVRHVLVQHVESRDRPLSLTRLRPEALALAEKALAQALADLGRWDALVRAYSDEPSTVGERGSLGSVARGSLTPELEEALLATPPGSVCPRVVESPGGFHVLWRVD